MSSYIKECIYLHEVEEGTLRMDIHPSGDCEITFQPDGGVQKTLHIGTKDYILRTLIDMSRQRLIDNAPFYPPKG